MKKIMLQRAFLFGVPLLLSLLFAAKGDAQKILAPKVGTLTAADDDEEEEKEHEGIGAIRYWQDLEERIRYVNRLNGVRNTDRQQFKTAGWRQVAQDKATSKTAGTPSGGWSQVAQSQSSVGMGRIETVAFSPSNANVFFVGTAGGGLWRTNDNGTSYFPVTDGLPSSGVTAIAIDPSNANNMYILTGSGLGGQSASSAGVFRSQDGGTTWYPTGLTDTIGGTDPLYAYQLKMHPTNANILFCCTNRGLYKTTDAGSHWDLVLEGSQNGSAGFNAVFDVVFKPDDPAVVYAAYYYKLYYSKSTGDAGTWQSTTTSFSGYPAGFSGNFLASRICVSAASPNTIHIASAVPDGDDNNNFRTKNGNVFYIKATYNSAAASNAISYASAKKVSACNQVCLRSGGGRWYGEIYVSQSNVNNILIGGLEVFASSDGGSSWVLKSINCTTGDRSVHADCGSKYTVQNGFTYVTSDGGLYRQAENYTSSSAAWTDITGGMEITQLYTLDGSPQDANYYLYANQDNGTHIRTSTASYSLFVGGDGTACKFDKTNKNNYYGCVQNGEFMYRRLSGVDTYITPGAGASNGDEKQYSGAFVFARCFALDEGDNNTLYAIKRSFYKSTNQGSKWTRYDIPGVQQPNVIMRVAKSNTQIIYAVESEWYDGSTNTYHPQRLRWSNNGGSNWSDITSLLPANILISDLAIDPQNAGTLYISCYGNVASKKLFRSINSGGTWASLSDGLPNVDARCIALVNEAKRGIYVGTDLGVYYRDNNLGKWIRYSNGLPLVQIMDLYLNPTLQTLSAATFGRGIFVTSLYDAASCPASLTLNSIYFNNTVYAASGTISSTGIIYPGAENFVTFSSGGSITLSPGFTASAGSGFRATIEGCSPTPIPYRSAPAKGAPVSEQQPAPIAVPSRKKTERKEEKEREEKERREKRRREKD